jgi:transcriptional regulator with XRE-family HTH domain
LKAKIHKKGVFIMLDAKIVGKVIQCYREKKGVSQEVLSGFADIGRTHLSAIERGERKPTLETFYRISQALEVSASELFRAIEDEIKNITGVNGK